MYSSKKGWPMIESDVVPFQSRIKMQRYELHSNSFIINSSSVITLKSSVTVNFASYPLVLPDSETGCLTVQWNNCLSTLLTNQSANNISGIL